MRFVLRFRKPGGRGFRLCLPEALVWPGLLLLGAVPFEFLLIRALIRPRRRKWRQLSALTRAVGLVGEARGLEIEITDEEGEFLLAFRE